MSIFPVNAAIRKYDFYNGQLAQDLWSSPT